MTLVTGGGAPQRWVRLLPRLGLHPALGHLPILTLELVLVVGPATHDVAEGLLPHLASFGGVDAEALELGPGGRAAHAHVDPPVREKIEHGHRFRRAYRMVVGLGHQADAVSQPDVLGPGRNGAVEHLGVRTSEHSCRKWCSTVQKACQPKRSPAMACSRVFW